MAADTWLDLALVDNETELLARLDSLAHDARQELVASLTEVVGISKEQLERATLRLLLERARPLALPAVIWKRRPYETWSIRDEATRHLARLGITVSGRRLQAMQTLYARFAATRERLPI